MPSAQFSHSTIAVSSLPHAWERLQRSDTWEAIGGIDEIFDAEHDTDGSLLGYRFAATAGGAAYEGSATVRDALAPTRIVLDIDSREVGGWIQTELANVANSEIEIRVTVYLESRGFLAGIFFGVLSRIVRDGLSASVEDFATRLASD